MKLTYRTKNHRARTTIFLSSTLILGVERRSDRVADEARMDPPFRQLGGLYLRFRGVVALGLFADFVSRGHFRVDPQSAPQRHGLHDAESLSGELDSAAQARSTCITTRLII